ncbi:phosphotransacetylase [Brevibacterium marinum]|uniref:Phosphotransacetylase n=1 Tax=Brevibacterium marinum TaxID=418643 RepID=A0A846S027_9MICO|nr:phosphotransacetylase [Brevibacterium marinum]NJC57035.1 phosphotransacetylase [Brevibacterium marinum]
MLKTPAARSQTNTLTAQPVPFPDEVEVDPMLLERVLGLCGRGMRPRVVLAESHDDRILRAAGVLAEAGLSPVLIGDREEVLRRGERLSIAGVDEWSVENPSDLAAGATGARIRRRAERKHRHLTEQWLKDPVCLAAAAVAEGAADAAVAGADRPTADVIRAALKIVGLAADSTVLSSSFLMKLADGRYLGFGDCAVIPVPDDEQLAAIAVATARTFAAITGTSPSVAMLSFSTAGSAQHTDIDTVRLATQRIRNTRPELDVDGELQFDAAIVESVAKSKAPDSEVAGHANVLVFPNLAAGNIGYKIAERLAGAHAFGPLLQGLAAPINDLSRGASVSDIVNVALITCLQALTPTTATQQPLREPTTEPTFTE